MVALTFKSGLDVIKIYLNNKHRKIIYVLVLQFGLALTLTGQQNAMNNNIHKNIYVEFNSTKTYG